MIANIIDNKRAFQIYIILNLVFSLLGLSIGFLAIFGLITHNWYFNYFGPISLFLVFGLTLVFGIFEFVLKPSYIELITNERELIIKYFSPNIRNGLRFILMLGYRKYLIELKISKLEYNDYKLVISNCGIRKVLILQKIKKSGIYETSNINISFLGQKKYTDLILSIDRMKNQFELIINNLRLPWYKLYIAAHDKLSTSC